MILLCAQCLRIEAISLASIEWYPPCFPTLCDTHFQLVVRVMQK